MRNGTVLRSDAHYPDEDKTFPVLLCRTPYDKGAAKQTEIGPELASRGYLVVMQDVRGRYASDGEFQPGFYSADHADAEDGHDTVEWVAGLPWSNGKVGTFGNSYDGWLQWEVACTRPPRLAAMMASGITANLLDRELGSVEHDGLFSRQRRHRLRVSVVDDLRWFVRRPRVRGGIGCSYPRRAARHRPPNRHRQRAERLDGQLSHLADHDTRSSKRSCARSIASGGLTLGYLTGSAKGEHLCHC